ncbi:MAG: HlyC/CorC family transporter [Tepidiphilus sp.]|jgi:CBS domain containing-hemolysin-like protein|uniref:Hemolysin or related protein, contains CBS domains n=1 Tax=Tepidiphilus thermophilus TaxID=876478 RepID=A0A0K6IUT6_9PROT|nr:hemolysin family protein [Tepidiphilus thermophilus]MBP6999269.1 HlyC/CorC family transporter [Tepidiphilus sp.]CUB06839.1 Hemolysin or related protein, contains CBS domains [Tepidiphilus thermophilus]
MTILFVLLLLVLASAFFSLAEISLAASRRLRLEMLAKEGNAAAKRILHLQDQPGHYFTVVQIGLNGVAILAGAVGESSITPSLEPLAALVLPPEYAGSVASSIAFLAVTLLFVVLADLVPKRLALLAPERIALVVAPPMTLLMRLLHPLVWAIDALASAVLRVAGAPERRREEVTVDEIVALADAATRAGTLLAEEQKLVTRVFELDERTVRTAMVPRDEIVYLLVGEAEESIRKKLRNHPHGKFPVCDGSLDRPVGYVDTRDLFLSIIDGEKVSLTAEMVVRDLLVFPDTLTLLEALQRFRSAGQDFALIVNEYAIVVGLLTLRDVMDTVVAVDPVVGREEMIVQRDADSWLLDGLTPIAEVAEVLGIDEFEGSEHFETIAGFMMYHLRKVPKRTDALEYKGYRFEVVDIDNYRIDQLLVTRLAPPSEAAPAAEGARAPAS